MRESFSHELETLNLEKKDLKNVYAVRNIYFDRYDYMFDVKNSQYRYTYVYWYRTKQTELTYTKNGTEIPTNKIIYGE